MDYFEPKTVSEALSLLAKHGAEAKVIAGGTDVMVDIKYKEEPGCLINIKKIPGLGAIQENGAGLRIGPLVTIRELETNKRVREKLPVLWEASHQFASFDPQHCDYWRRTAPAFWRNLDAAAGPDAIQIAFSDGKDWSCSPLFFRGRQERSIGLLTSRRPTYGSKSVYLKHAARVPWRQSRRGLDHAGCGEEQFARRAHGLGAGAPTPLRASKTEALLRGKPLTAALLKEAAAMAASEASPISDQRSSAEYRRWIVEALTRRGLEQTWKAATGKEVA